MTNDPKGKEERVKKIFIALCVFLLVASPCWAVLDNAEAKWRAAESLRRQHKLDKAEEMLKEAIRLDPDFFPAYISLACIKYIRTDFEGTVRLISKVMQEDSGRMDANSYVQACILYAAAKGTLAHSGGLMSKIINGKAALDSLRKAEKLQPDSASVLYGFGNYYLLAPFIAGGNLKKAEEYLNKAIEADPLLADAYVRLGQVYKLKGDNEKFKVYLGKALEIDPQGELALDIKEGTCKFICIGE